MLVDDHAVVRAGYKRYIELDENLRVEAEAATGENAYEILETTNIDLVIMDLSMPGQGGFETLRRMKNRFPQQKIIIFSMHENAAVANQVLKLGANGYLTKSMQPDALIEAIHEVMQGGTVIDENLANSLEDLGTGDNPHKELLPREFEIFTLLAQGLTVEKISEKLHLTSKTVSNYQTIIRKKLNLHSTLEMQRYALARGILTIQE
jgi:DNA-binding NarL/FixJ family response regulator